MPFVVDYNIFFPDDNPEDRRGDYEIDDDGVADVSRFFVTTRQLLIFSSNAKLILQTDATYSVNWKLPGGICRTSALQNFKFCISALCFLNFRIL